MKRMEGVTRNVAICKIDANGNLLYDSGNSNGALYQPRGVIGEGGWREVHEGGDKCIPMTYSS